jgi:hypothetical protein
MSQTEQFDVLASALTQTEGTGRHLSFARIASAGLVQTQGFSGGGRQRKQDVTLSRECRHYSSAPVARAISNRC